jgi:hypothetical protein
MQVEAYLKDKEVRKFNLLQVPLARDIYNKISAFCKDVLEINIRNTWRIFTYTNIYTCKN